MGPRNANANADMDTARGRCTGTPSQTIFVLGPSSSGKTTLCGALSWYLALDPARCIAEVARTVMRARGFTRDDVDTFEMQHAIMTAQLAAERAVLARTRDEAGVRLLSDRSAVDPVVYAATAKTPGADERRRRLMLDSGFQAALPLYRRSLFVVLQPVKEWIKDDGVRTLEDPWTYNTHLFAALDELAIPYITIGADLKDIESRVAFVAAFVQ